MTDNNSDITSNDIKTLMDYVSGLKKEIDILKAVDKPVDKTPEIQVNPFDKSAEAIKLQEDLKKQIELEYKAKEIVSTFDKRYSGYLSTEDLTIVNNSNADDNHKAVEKFTRIFKNETNYELLPISFKDEVKQIISMNDTDKAKFTDINKLDTILVNFSDIKDKVDLNNSRFLGNNIPKKESIAEAKWKEAIAKANGNGK
jgi:hypothetical protein